MSSKTFHDVDQCHVWNTHVPLKFSHKRYFLIQIKRILFFRTDKPYLSQDALSRLCDYKIRVFKGQIMVNRKKLNKAHSLYVNSAYLRTFLAHYGNQLKVKVIVSGSSDTNFDEKLDLPSSLSLGLIQNLGTLSDVRLRTLPAGIENIRLGRAGLKKFHKKSVGAQIYDRVLVPPMSPTNPNRRVAIVECLTRPEIFDVKVQLLNEKSYFALCKKYKFIFCLEGNGHDAHRIWETLYQGSFPILLDSKFSQSLAQWNFPILIIPSIEKLSLLSLSKFNAKYSDFDPAAFEKLWIPFWKTAIKLGKVER